MHIDLPATRPAIGYCSYNSDGYTHYYVYSNEKIIDGDINIFSTMKVSTYTCFVTNRQRLETILTGYHFRVALSHLGIDIM